MRGRRVGDLDLGAKMPTPATRLDARRTTMRVYDACVCVCPALRRDFLRRAVLARPAKEHGGEGRRHLASALHGHVLVARNKGAEAGLFARKKPRLIITEAGLSRINKQCPSHRYVRPRQGRLLRGAKKISIKPLKIKPKIPENFEAETWAKLRAAVRAVHAKQAVGHSFEELYRAVEDMCLQNLAGTVYDRLRAECEQHIESRLELLLGQTPDVLAFLTLVQACWADHCEQMLTLRSIFLYLDRTYVMQAATKKSLWDMGLQIFRTHPIAAAGGRAQSRPGATPINRVRALGRPGRAVITPFPPPDVPRPGDVCRPLRGALPQSDEGVLCV